ncbi:MAG: HNH endonuclease [Gammaproteobacteria bacterium]|nr:MAG: HNH endonuclease [Gammaproteobacteria bacterium]RLA49786.1 MAG: HNH endonuclease [Gammaproteobacteria bacterium]
MSWTHEQKLAAWNKAKTVGENDSKVWRQDDCDAWIKWSEYGNRDSQYGWEMDHITSQDHGGGDEDSNLRALRWENNVSKGEGRLKCAVTSNGTNNAPV